MEESESVNHKQCADELDEYLCRKTTDMSFANRGIRSSSTREAIASGETAQFVC